MLRMLCQLNVASGERGNAQNVYNPRVPFYIPPLQENGPSVLIGDHTVKKSRFIWGFHVIYLKQG